MKWYKILISGVLVILNHANADIKAILFDCDGTLVDSEPVHYVAWKETLLEWGYDFTIEEYYPYVGKSAEENARLLSAKIKADCPELILQKKREKYRELIKQGMPAIEATVSFLKALAEQKEQLGIKIGVCSAGKKPEILAHLRFLGVESLLDIVLSGQEDLAEYSDPEGVNKPKPYIYLHAAKLLGVSPKECVVIEDSPPGIAAGVSAGCITIAVPNDCSRHQDLSEAHLCLESFSNMSYADLLHLLPH